MVAFLVLLQNGKYLVLREEWIENPKLSINSKVFFSPNRSTAADFTKNVKYFFKDDETSCYMASICKKFNTEDEGLKYLEKREPRASRWLTGKHVRKMSQQVLEQIDLISESSSDDEISNPNKENLSPDQSHQSRPVVEVSNQLETKMMRKNDAQRNTPNKGNPLQKIDLSSGLSKHSVDNQTFTPSQNNNVMNTASKDIMQLELVEASAETSQSMNQIDNIGNVASMCMVSSKLASSNVPTTSESNKNRPVVEVSNQLKTRKIRTDSIKGNPLKENDLSSGLSQHSVDNQTSNQSQYNNDVNTASEDITHSGLVEVHETSGAISNKSKKRELNDKLQHDRGQKMRKTSLTKSQDDTSARRINQTKTCIESDKSMIQIRLSSKTDVSLQPKSSVGLYTHVSEPNSGKSSSASILLRRDYLLAKKD